MQNQITTKNFYDLMIRLAFLVLIIGWCLMLILPFTSIMLWSIIFALAFKPMHDKLSKALKGSPKLASLIIVAVCVSVIVLLGWLFFDSIISSVRNLKTGIDNGTLAIPPPTDDVKSWPVIGGTVYAIWNSASVSLEQSLLNYKEQVIEIGGKIVKGLLGIGSGSLQMIASLIIAGFLLAISGVGESIRSFFRKLTSDRGDEFADITLKTVGNVVKGILGVSLIQAVILGIGFILAGVPYAGIWTLVVFLVAVLQIPPTVVVIPVIIYLFASLETLPAILWTIYLIAGGISDNILKPIMLGAGAPVPMLVIFLGVIGGFMLSGFIGLFTGAIVLSIGYKMLVAWIEDDKNNNGKQTS